MIIDADAHVLETERTWDYMEPADRKRRPVAVTVGERELWVIDGKIRGVKFASLSERELSAQSERIGRNVVTPQASREMDDVGLRLKHMDQLGIDMEVLHNTIFIRLLTDRPEVEVPLCRAWNRWVADIWKQGEGRLRWTCMPPTLSISDALDEIRFAKQNGAVGIILRPIEGNRILVDPYFYPIYEEACRLDMPITVHIGHANQAHTDLYTSPFEQGSAFGLHMAPTAVMCHQVMMSELPQLFPTLRWAIVEAGAAWLPWVIGEAKRRYPVIQRPWPEEGFGAFRIWVTCQTNNDVPYIMQHSGEDRIMIGTDYGHTDISSEVDAITVMRETGGLSPEVFQKVVEDNPRACFGI